MSTLSIKEPVTEIGKLIRCFREKTKRNLSDVAAAAGISTSMLSQIERGMVSPSIETLFLVCESLKLDIRDLFGRLSPKPQVRIVRPPERLSTSNRGIRYEQLVTSPDLSHAAELFLLEVTPGASIGIEGKGHEGVEMGYVLEGEAVLSIEQKSYTIGSGDSLSFSSHLPHRLENAGAILFKALWAVLPPHRDYLEME